MKPPEDVAGILLKRARRRREWSQAEMARRAGVPASQLSAYETGAKQPRVETLARILAVAGEDLVRRGAISDRERQARELEDVLELVDAMPARRRPAQMAFGPFARLVRP